ncbi:carboxymuconolactone decarboxylase family protein [Pseudomonas sp. BN415]|uniref:carboxymuconolactone decarboxylase family protein n=1 Tax=Pseudomonas sp. BN415 TaxID=2567889 RepID=UPI002456B4D7|nr:carboxymuconolactone decarboxylase family protein [Pseudomonas sp. BN415]
MDIRNSLPDGNWQLTEQRTTLNEPEHYSAKLQAILAGLRKTSNAERNLNVFLLFAKLGDVLGHYLPFFTTLLFAGRISRVDKEKIILRVAWRVGCAYEWIHHTKLAQLLRIDVDEVSSLAVEHSESWSPRVAAYVRATDELLTSKTLTTEAWNDLRVHLSDEQIIEFCFLVGHYVMVAMTINASGIPVEPQYLQSH